MGCAGQRAKGQRQGPCRGPAPQTSACRDAAGSGMAVATPRAERGGRSGRGRESALADRGRWRRVIGPGGVAGGHGAAGRQNRSFICGQEDVDQGDRESPPGTDVDLLRARAEPFSAAGSISGCRGFRRGTQQAGQVPMNHCRWTPGVDCTIGGSGRRQKGRTIRPGSRGMRRPANGPAAPWRGQGSTRASTRTDHDRDLGPGWRAVTGPTDR